MSVVTGDVRADQEVPDPGRLGCADGDGMVRGAGDELVNRGVGDQVAITARRVDAVIDIVGLRDVAGTCNPATTTATSSSTGST